MSNTHLATERKAEINFNIIVIEKWNREWLSFYPGRNSNSESNCGPKSRKRVRCHNLADNITTTIHIEMCEYYVIVKPLLYAIVPNSTGMIKGVKVSYWFLWRLLSDITYWRQQGNKND